MSDPSWRVVDADAHVNEDVLAWRALAEARPGWIGATRSAGRWVAEIEGRAYPAQEGPGCGVDIRRSTNPACADGAGDAVARLAGEQGLDEVTLHRVLAGNAARLYRL